MNFIERQNHKITSIIKTYLLKDENTRRWEELKDKFKGKRVFLLGNGPSLNRTPLYLLKDEYTLCLNRFYMLKERLNWDPYFYMCIDPLVVPDIYNEINDYIKAVNYAFFQEIHKEYIKFDTNVYWMTEINPINFRYKLPLISRGSQTVAIAGIQVLMYLGFSEIYLLGVDQNYKLHMSVKEMGDRRIESQHDDDPNHFDPRYFGKGRKYHQPDQWARDRMLVGFKQAKKSAERSGIKILNAGVGGQLEVFDRVNFESLFSFTDAQNLQLFSEVFGKSIDLVKLNNLFDNTEFLLKDTKDDNSNREIFTMLYKEGEEYIQKIIFSHIPFGPIKNKYLFLRRDSINKIINKFLKQI